MNKFAIKHTPMSEDAHGINERQVVIRIRTARNDIKQCRIFFGDRACRQTPVIFSSASVACVLWDEYFDYYEVILTDKYKRLCYYFELSDNQETLYYYGDLFTKELVDDRSEYYQLPYNHRADIVAPPSWAQDAVIYNIFPDSFATQKGSISQIPIEKPFKNTVTKGKLGGTIKGITQNVEYLKDLGVNAIYINPIFVAGEYHKYDLLDYMHIDPVFGTDNDFKELVKVYHQNGLKVIIDGVFNHCGWKFFAFEDVVKNGKSSAYADWFYKLEYPVIRPEDMDEYPSYECFAYERMMPKLNTQNPQVIEYFTNVCAHWISEYDIDGWRLDVASEVNTMFWRSFMQTAKKLKPDAIMIGEVWETARYWLDGTIFDSTMNYDFRKHARRFFAEKSIDAQQFQTRVANMLMRYRKNTVYAQLNLLDSHDVSRFLSLCGEDVQRFKAAVLFQMTFVGMPSVFYGDELGISGIIEDDYRHPMPWGKNHELYAFYKAAIALRMEHSALRRGNFATLQADKSSGLYAFSRTDNNETIYIAINMQKAEELPEIFADKEFLWQCGLENNTLNENGFIIAK
ncbi:MAG: glycoside hydrolase family 13 protein [Oscillospiraceae bacterium]